MPDDLSFSAAIDRLKAGDRVARAGWNGKGMFVYLTKGSFDGDGVPAQPVLIDGIPSDLFALGDHGSATRLPHISMATATGATLNGWLASQTDMLAEDWAVVEASEAGNE